LRLGECRRRHNIMSQKRADTARGECKSQIQFLIHRVVLRFPSYFANAAD
jgi:hypothetical protein